MANNATEKHHWHSLQNYGVRGVSQIKFTMSDSFLVFHDFDILSIDPLTPTPFDACYAGYLVYD